MFLPFSPTALTAEKYDKTIQVLEAAGDFPPAGLDYHVCFGSEGNLVVSEIWHTPNSSRLSVSGSCRS